MTNKGGDDAKANDTAEKMDVENKELKNSDDKKDADEDAIDYGEEEVENSEVEKADDKGSKDEGENRKRKADEDDGPSPKKARRSEEKEKAKDKSKEAPRQGRRVSPSRKKPSRTLRIDNFVRPFTQASLKEMLSKNGSVESLWMDRIKTHCLVTFSTEEEAEATRKAVHRTQWPDVHGRILFADFIPEEVAQRIIEQAKIIPKTERERERERVLKGQQEAKKEKPKKKEPSPPPVTLEDLFRKTAAKPPLYWLPLSDEQVAANKKKKEEEAGTSA